MRLLDRLFLATGTAPVVPVSPEVEERMSMDDWVMSFAGNTYPLGYGPPQGPPGVPSETAPNSFDATVTQVYYRSGIVAACIAARVGLISEARFKFRNFSDRKMFGSEALLPLEAPIPNATSGDILARFEQDANNGVGLPPE